MHAMTYSKGRWSSPDQRSRSDLHPFRQHQGILDIDTQIPHCGLDLRMPKQNLHCPQVPGLLLDQGGFCSTQGMGAIVLRAQTDGRHPLIDKPSILARTQVPPLIASAGKDEIIQRAAPTLQPCQDRRARRSVISN